MGKTPVLKHSAIAISLLSFLNVTKLLEKEMTLLKLWVASLVVIVFVGLLLPASALAQQGSAKRDDVATGFTRTEIPTADGLTITADLYATHENKNTPFIVLCHQAGWSRGEYREIAPKLNALGFNCLAIDQRSGGKVKGVANELVRQAKAAKKGTNFPDAEQDMITALKWARANQADGKLVLWGSSYSAALSLRITGEEPNLIDGVMAFSPGEYFKRFGKPGDWIAASAKKISVPVFVTSAKREHQAWKAIFESIPEGAKTSFLPKTAGNHGSHALWSEFSDSDAYWTAVKSFLKQFSNS